MAFQFIAIHSLLVIFRFLCVADICGQSLALDEAFSMLGKGIHIIGNGVPTNIILPVVKDSLTKRRILSVTDFRDMVDHLEIYLDQISIVLDLELNKNLVSSNFGVRHHVDGKEDIWRPEASTEPFSCHYRGTIRNVPNSWVTMSICFGLSGVVFDGQNVYYIEPLNETNSLDGEHSWTLHGHADVTLPRSHDGVHNAVLPTSNYSMKVKRAFQEVKRVDSFFAGHTIKLLLVVDYTIYRRSRGHIPKILKRTLDVANGIHQIYSKLSSPITVVVVGVIIWSDGDQIVISRDPSDTLAAFKDYRVRHTNLTNHDTALLMTGMSGEYFGGPVGRAYVETICKSHHDSCGIAVDNITYSSIMTASIMAHEMGHNLGMFHDDSSLCHCREGTGSCVMTPMIWKPTMEWSDCSQRTIQDFARQGSFSCLRNQPNRCGNMVVDPGEECDCGLPVYCKNKCCDPVTCKFNKDSPYPVICASGECCDLLTCQLEIAGVECRSVVNECDLPEFCSGNSSLCPADLHKHDGVSCHSNKVCVDKKCNKVSRTFVNICPLNCSNNGMCNNLGKCHCQDGFSPPNCQTLGFGGSEHGGYGSSPKAQYLELYIIFLAVIPILMTLIFGFYYFLNEEQKKFFWIHVQHTKSLLHTSKGVKWFARSHPIPLHQSTSVDKTVESGSTEKRNFTDWVKNRVRLSLPTINILPVNDSNTPGSDCSTATTIASEVHTPDNESSFPFCVANRQPPIHGQTLMPPVHRLIRPVPTIHDNQSSQDAAPKTKKLFQVPLTPLDESNSYDRPLPRLPTK